MMASWYIPICRENLKESTGLQSTTIIHACFHLLGVLYGLLDTTELHYLHTHTHTHAQGKVRDTYDLGDK